MKETDHGDCERIQKQVLSASSLWKNMCHLLSSAMQTTNDILRQYEMFVEVHKQLSDWLTSVEESVAHDLEESFLSSAVDQGDTVFHVSTLPPSSFHYPPPRKRKNMRSEWPKNETAQFDS